MRSSVLLTKTWSLAIAAVLSLVFILGVGTAAQATSGWNSNTSPIATGTTFCGFTPASVVSTSDGGMIALVASGSTNCSLDLRKSADGGQTWSSPISITSAPRVRNQSLTVLNNGKYVAIWSETTGNSNAAVIRFSQSQDEGATWSTPNTISTAGNNPFDSYYPVAAPLGTNGIAFSWVEHDGSNTRAMIRTSPDLSSWTAPRALSAAGSNATQTALATNSNGDIVVAWQILDGNGRLTLFVAGSSNWVTSARQLSSNPAGNSPSPVFTTLSNGSIALTWFDLYDPANSKAGIYTATTSDAGANWSSNTVIANNFVNYLGLSVTKTNDNGLLATWASSLTGWANIHTAKGNATGTTWSTPVDVNPQGSLPNATPVIAAGPDGTAMVGYREISGGTDGIFTAYSTNNGTSWQAPAQLATHSFGYPGFSLSIQSLQATGFAVMWNDNPSSGAYNNYVRTYNWSAPVTPPAPTPAPALANTGMNSVLLGAGVLGISFMGIGVSILLRRKATHRA